MSMEGILYAVVPYSKKITGLLNYPAHYYSHLPEGTPILTKVLFVSTTSQTKELAKILRIHLYGGQFSGTFTHNDLINAKTWEGKVAFSQAEVDYILLLQEAGAKFFLEPNA